jgi:hypothetical protein
MKPTATNSSKREFELAPAAKIELERQREAFSLLLPRHYDRVASASSRPSPCSILTVWRKTDGFWRPISWSPSYCCFLLIYFVPSRSFNKLLKLEEYANKNKQETDKVIGIVAATIWPLAAATYLLLGFTRGMWGTAWIIFPILGIVFGVFSAIYTGIKKS